MRKPGKSLFDKEKINLCHSQGDTDIRIKDINTATRSVF